MPPIDLLHKVFGWPGVAVLCGVLPLVCAVLLIKTAVKNRQVQWVSQAPFVTVSTLQPSLQPVRFKGRIAGVTQPLAERDTAGYAVLGIRVEALDEENGWETRIFRLQTTPFWLDDGTGLIVVDPAHLDREFLGEGIAASQEQVEEVVQILGCSPAHVQEPGLRSRVWELRKDQQVTVVGAVFERDGRKYITKAEGRPLVITTMDEISLGHQSTHQLKVALFWAAILGIPGLFVLLFAGREVILAVGRLFNG
jgi:hypothetical protein